MRIRSIKPEFWEDEKVAMLPVQARLTFIGLWNLADDSGYFRSSVVATAAALYRFEATGRRNRHVSDAMSRLEAAGMLKTLGCGQHAVVVNLPQHQRLAGEGRQVHTFRREHDDECTADAQVSGDSAPSPHIPAEKRGTPRNARTSPPSRAPAGREGKVSANADGKGEGGVEGEGARDVPPRGAPSNGSRSVDPRTIDDTVAILQDTSKPDAVRRVARQTLERYAPERLAQLEAAS